MTRPLHVIEKRWRAEYIHALKEYNAAKKRGDEDLEKPVCRRLITQDATMEKLHEILHDNPHGMLLICDELTGWMATLDKPGREGERGFFLSAWNGDTPYTMDRIRRGSICVEHCCISMLGGIQPARLRGYLLDAVNGGPGNDGLLQRFQLLVYPDVVGTWRYVDRPPLPRAGVQALFERLVGLKVPDPFRFAPDAQQLFVAWLTELEAKIRDPKLHPALVSHLSKYRSLMPSLALLFQLADGANTATVSLDHTQQAVGWCVYLESHARRVYATLFSPEMEAAIELGRHLLEALKRGEKTLHVREIYRACWHGLDRPEKVRAAVEVLSKSVWVRRVDGEKRTGRPSETYGINPRLLTSATELLPEFCQF